MNTEKLNLINEITSNQSTIETLKQETQKKIASFIGDYIFSGNVLIKICSKQIEIFNNLSFSRFDESKPELSNFDYINLHPEREYYFNGKHIVELYFEDTLEVTKHWAFKHEEKVGQVIIELIFKSKRVRNVKLLKRNYFRFVYYIADDKITCRILTL